MTDFYLISGEHGPDYQYEPRACTIVRRLRNAFRDDFALVRVDQPIPMRVHYDDEYVSELLLVARLVGRSLFPIDEWPLQVYVCHLKYQKGETVHDNIDSNFVVIDWGKVHLAREQAEAS